jgi:hypothetical protein
LIEQGPGTVLAHFGHAAIAELSPVLGDKAEVGFQARQGQLLADIVAKVENRTTLKISRKLIFGLLSGCVAFQLHHGGP